MIPEYKLGWVAGVLDFKGTVVRKNNKLRKTPQLCLMVESVNLDVVDELCRLTGTDPETKEKRPRKDWMRRGCVTHCPEPDIEYPGDRETLPAQGRWTVTGAAAVIVLSAVQKYMITDRSITAMLEEAQLNLVTSGRGVGNVRAAMNRLAALGWPIPRGMRQRVAGPVPPERASAHKAG